MSLSFILYALFNAAFVIIISPFFITLIKKVKAYAQGRRGPSLFQGYFNLLKLLQKEVVYSSTSSSIMRMTPYINIISLVIAATFVPLIFIPEPSTWAGNIFLFIYLLGLAKFFMALGGLDPGSTFGGMGSSREMALSSLVEPVLIVIFGVAGFAYHSMNFFDIFHKISQTPLLSFNPSLMLLVVSLFIVLIVESARIPVDNPETHLELTMIHEAMLLEHSGRNLALMELSSAIKQVLLMGILINLFFPLGISTSFSIVAIFFGAAAFIIKSIIVAIFIGIFESYFAKLRLFRLPHLFAIAFFLVLITLILEVLI